MQRLGVIVCWSGAVIIAAGSLACGALSAPAPGSEAQPAVLGPQLVGPAGDRSARPQPSPLRQTVEAPVSRRQLHRRPTVLREKALNAELLPPRAAPLRLGLWRHGPTPRSRAAVRSGPLALVDVLEGTSAGSR